MPKALNDTVILLLNIQLHKDHVYFSSFWYISDCFLSISLQSPVKQKLEKASKKAPPKEKKAKKPDGIAGMFAKSAKKHAETSTSSNEPPEKVNLKATINNKNRPSIGLVRYFYAF